MTNAEARFNHSLRPRKPEGSLGRTAQDVHLDSHTAPELCAGKPNRRRALTVSVTTLFNIVLQTGKIPHAWSIGYISPIYKGKGEENDPDNYRGITVLSCFGKLFTSVINDRIHSF